MAVAICVKLNEPFGRCWPPPIQWSSEKKNPPFKVCDPETIVKLSVKCQSRPLSKPPADVLQPV
jgi:hypothetical protein